MEGTLENPKIVDKTHLNNVPKPGYRIAPVTITQISKKGIVKQVTYNRQYKVKKDVPINGRSLIAGQLKNCNDTELLAKIQSLIEESKNKQDINPEIEQNK